MKNLLILNHQVLYLCINDGTESPVVYVRRPNQTEFTVEYSIMSFERLEKRLLNTSLHIDHYEYTSVSNPTELRELYPELLL